MKICSFGRGSKQVRQYTCKLYGGGDLRLRARGEVYGLPPRFVLAQLFETTSGRKIIAYPKAPSVSLEHSTKTGSDRGSTEKTEFDVRSDQIHKIDQFVGINTSWAHV